MKPLTVLLFGLLLSASVSAQELFSDFPSASLSSWTVAQETIELVGSETWTEERNAYRWVYFGADGVLGATPTFQIGSFDNSFLGDLQGHRFVWSYDQEIWSFFDNNFGDSFDFRFSNDQPFSQDEVFVAYSTPYPVSRTEARVEEMKALWFVTPTTSSNSDLVLGSVSAGDGEHPLYGFRITNPLVVEPKTKVVLVGGNHSGETAGNFALEGMVNFLASDDPRAMQMRNVAEFYVYPQVDPLGRDEGFYRGNSQNPANDHNRFWNAATSGDNGGFAEIDVVTEAMRLDTDGDADFTFDFHGFFDAGENFIYSDSAGTETEFLQELQLLQPSLAIEVDDGTEPAGILEFWAKTPAGLNSDFAFTPEFSANALADELRLLGEDYALAMFAELGRPDFVRSSSEIDTLNRALSDSRSILDEPGLDLNRDGKLDAADLEFLLAEIVGTNVGDANLDGAVDFADFLALSDNFGDGGGWGDGDFTGDGQILFADFLVLSDNFGAARVAANTNVPEAMGTHWICMIANLVLLRRVRKR